MFFPVAAYDIILNLIAIVPILAYAAMLNSKYPEFKTIIDDQIVMIEDLIEMR